LTTDVAADRDEQAPSGVRPKVGIVLGGTRGIGLALTAALAREWRPDDHVYLTARSGADGERACATLRATGSSVRWLQFDLADPPSPARVADELRRRHGGVDVVVQNGAYMPRANVPARDDARPMIEANSHGTLRVLRAFLPVLREGGRLIVVASGFGRLKHLPEPLRARFVTTGGDPDAINRAMDEYVKSVEAGTAAAEGWPEWVNVPSKVGQVAVTRAFARWAMRTGALPRDAFVAAACPGVTLTDGTREFMGTQFRPESAQTPDEAARDLVWLATLPPGHEPPHGELVQHRRVLAFGD
jgi:NAD(P)-dependent dehydrogenase (short-subunit alcohol dehydrogenase family)